MYAFIFNSLPISVLRSLDTKANKFYDRTNRLYDAALLTRCYTQYALRPVIDSKINHIIHFIKISFISKGMDFIDLRSSLRDKSVQSSIPNYFKDFEVPIICYKYNKPIRGAMIGMLSSHLMQSEIIIYGLVRKCVKLSPFS